MVLSVFFETETLVETLVTMADAQDLAGKKRVRNGHRTSTKRTISLANDLLTSVDDKSKLALHAVKLTLYKKTLEDKLVVFQQQDNVILDLVGDDDVELEIEQADILRENMQSTILENENALTEIAQPTESAKGVVESNSSPLPPPQQNSTPPSPQQNSTPPSPQHNPTQQASQTNQIETVLAIAGFEEVQGPGLPGHSGITTQSSHQNNQPSVELPKLSLKKFSGDVTTWTTFWDTFESAIHKNPNLSDIDKFNYLNSLLENAAADAISGLTLTSGNYNEAIVILKKRFGNKQLAINKHMDVLLKLDPVTSIYDLII